MDFKRIEKNSNIEIIFEQIENKIKKGELKEGEKLPSELELSDLFGVSRTSVREAIIALVYSGYLDVIQGKGIFVSNSARKYDEIYSLMRKISNFSLSSLIEVRVMLEGEFARLAAIRASQNDIKEIEECFINMKNAKSMALFVLKDLDFHLAIAQATKNPLMNTLMKVFGEMLHQQTRDIVKLSVSIKERIIELSAGLVNAIKNRDPRKARQLMIEHLTIVLNKTEELYTENYKKVKSND